MEGDIAVSFQTYCHAHRYQWYFMSSSSRQSVTGVNPVQIQLYLEAASWKSTKMVFTEYYKTAIKSLCTSEKK